MRASKLCRASRGGHASSRRNLRETLAGVSCVGKARGTRATGVGTAREATTTCTPRSQPRLCASRVEKWCVRSYGQLPSRDRSATRSILHESSTQRPSGTKIVFPRVIVVAVHAFCSPSARQSAAREIRRGRGTRPARTPAGSARTFARLAGGKRTRESSRRGAFGATEASRRARPATKTTGNDGERAVRADGVQVV
jgi:hypothetical protein